MLPKLNAAGYDIASRNHAQAVLSKDFPVFFDQLCSLLANFQIEDAEIVKGGGGKSTIARRLGEMFVERGWKPRTVEVKKTVEGKVIGAPSHQMDHICDQVEGHVAIEIEWNNKDTFFDRDLANFRRLHTEGWLSAGIIVTRGRTLHEGLPDLMERYAEKRGISRMDDLKPLGINPNGRQRARIRRTVEGREIAFSRAWAEGFVADKFSASTTHWTKLEERISRGEGNPCPMLLLGIPASLVGSEPASGP